jgi:hypothetical protein
MATIPRINANGIWIFKIEYQGGYWELVENCYDKIDLDKWTKVICSNLQLQSVIEKMYCVVKEEEQSGTKGNH